MTGGDPLVLSPRRIRELTRALSEIPHVHKLRWHSRVPVVAPNRITPALCSALMDTDRTVRVAIHANHAREFTNPARGAMRLMHEHAIALLSQSVLLRGVNDDVETMAALLTAYSEAGVKSYYLHHGDLAPGTSHFRTTIAHGMELMSALAAAIPRSLLPTYVLDLPGGHGKIPITAANFTRQPDGAYAVRTPNTQRIVYRDVV